MPLSPAPKFQIPFNNNGVNRNAIPVASQIGIQPGVASYTDGFVPLNMTPIASGGVPPFGQDMNGILFAITNALQWQQATAGGYAYDATFQTQIGGYPIGAIVQRSDGTGFWLNTAANNLTAPETGGAGWQPLGAGATSVAMSNTNVTLTALQAARSIIIITGTLTANIQLIFPTYVQSWIVVNAASGAFTVTAKTAAGSGVSIATGSPQAIYGDGVNILTTSSGRLIGVQRILSSGTYTPTPGTNSVIVDIVGGGGGGGGVAATVAGQNSAAGGGGAGARTVGRLTSGFAGVSITIGSGGAGGAIGASGSSGGGSSFGALMTVGGGAGGATTTAPSPYGAIGGVGGSVSVAGNIFNGNGQPGSPAASFISTSFFSGSGGPSPLGGGGGVGLGTSTSAGSASTTVGGGGGGAINGASSAGQVGGSGAAGIAIIYEYS